MHDVLLQSISFGQGFLGGSGVTCSIRVDCIYSIRLQLHLLMICV